MNKTTKGAVAAGAAAVLLLGGAGSLAYWTSTATVNGGTITSGQLSITPLVRGTNAGACDTNFIYASTNGSANPANPVGSVVKLFVPGDVITKTCTFTIRAQGDNLSATPTVQLLSTAIVPAPVPAKSLVANTTATYTVAPAGGGTGTALIGNKITSTNDTNVLTAVITVTIPNGTNEAATTKVNANDTQNITATLSQIGVTLVQDRIDGGTPANS